MDDLQDPIGYDSGEIREMKRLNGDLVEGHAINFWLGTNKKVLPIVAVARASNGEDEVGPAECEVCHVALGPVGKDDNHHSSLFTDPVHHFCAAHCPACNAQEGLRQLFGDMLGVDPDDITIDVNEIKVEAGETPPYIFFGNGSPDDLDLTQDELDAINQMADQFRASAPADGWGAHADVIGGPDDDEEDELDDNDDSGESDGD